MKIRFSSLQYLANSAWVSLRRFPLVIASVMLVFVAETIVIERDYQNDYLQKTLTNLVLTSAMGVPLFFALAVYAESHNRKFVKEISIAAGMCFLLLVYFGLPDTTSTLATEWPYVRYVLLSIAIHLFIAFAPFIRPGENHSFWQFNKMLFLRLWVSLLYAGVLCLGIILAIVSVHLLFDVEINNNLYQEVFVFHLSVVNIWIFMSGVDHPIVQAYIDTYPKGLRIFAQYILLSLLVLYLLILYFYVIKTIIIWDWPKGIMAYLTLGVAALGYLTTLLLYPYAQQAEYSWVRKFSHVFYTMMLPLSAVLFIAIGMRLYNYGFTINRYFILVLGIWLAVLSAYKILKPNSIKIIPVSLSAVVLLSSFGFWGAHAVSRRSQVSRLQHMLEEAHLLQNDQLVTEKEYLTGRYLHRSEEAMALSDSLSQEIASTIRYLDSYYRFGAIQPWFEQSLDSLVNRAVQDSSANFQYFDEAQAVLEIMDIERLGEKKLIYLEAYENNLVVDNITGYDYMIPKINAESYEDNKNRIQFKLEGDLYTLTIDANTQLLMLTKEQQTVIQAPMRTFFIQWEKQYQRNNAYTTPKVLTDSSATSYSVFEVQENGYQLKISFQFAEIAHGGKAIKLEHYEGKAYLRLPVNP